MLILLLVFSLFVSSTAHAAENPTWHTLSNASAQEQSPKVTSESRPDGVTLDISIPGYVTHSLKSGGNDYQSIDLPGWQTNSEIGVPLIPQLVQCIAIPNNCRLEDIAIDILNSDSISQELSLPPVPKSIDGNYSFLQNPKIYDQDNYYPRNTVTVEKTGFIREQKAAWIRINPVQYNPVSHRILIHKNLKLKIRFNNLSPIKPGPFSEIGPTLFLNAEKSAEPPSRLHGPGSVTYPTDLLNAPVNADYILITTDGLIHEAVLDSLAQYRARFSGLDLAVVNTVDIYAQFPAGDSSLSIRGFLIHAYEHWTPKGLNDGHPTYTLLVGDGNPASFNYLPGFDDKPADHQYACVNDDNGDGDIDFKDRVCDLMLGRLSVEDKTELGSVFRKMRRYEASLSENQDWLRKICLVNGFLDTLAAPTTELYNDKFNESAADQEYYTISETLNKLELGTDGLRSAFIDAFNAGRGIIDINAHGLAEGWSDTGNQIMFMAGDMPLLNNGERLPVVLSFSCYTGDFTNSGGDCLGEAMVNAPDAGAIAFVGSGGLENLESNLPFNLVFFKILMSTQNLSLGAVFTASQWLRTDLSTGYSLIGDPALSFNKPVTGLLPDLSVEFIKDNWSQLAIAVENWGMVKADSVKVQFYNGDPRTGGVPIDTPMVIGSIAPFGGKKIYNPVFHNLPEGAITLYAWVDPDNKFTEIHEDNNISSGSAIADGFPDLAIYLSHIRVLWGVSVEAPVRITADFTNNGNVSVKNVAVGFFDGDPDSGGVCIGRDTLAVVERNSNYSASLLLDHYTKNGITVYVRIDPDNAIGERHETNNTTFIHESKGPIHQADYGLIPEQLNFISYYWFMSGDFNNDGLVDFIDFSPWAVSGSLHLNCNNFGFNDISFVGPVGQPSPRRPPVDFDNDGLLDVYVAQNYPDYQSFVAHNLGQGRFEKNTCPDLSGVNNIYYDFNSDGLPDLLTVQRNISVSNFILDVIFRYNTGNGEFVTGRTSLYVDSSMNQISYYNMNINPILADFDDDSNPDLFISLDIGPAKGRSFYKQILMKNNGDGTFYDATADAGIDEIVQKNADVLISGPLCLDMDYDGDMDILSYDGTVYTNNGGYFNRSNLSMKNLANIFDIDNDGLLECFGPYCTDSRCGVISYELDLSGELVQVEDDIISSLWKVVNEFAGGNIFYFYNNFTDYDGDGFVEPLGYKNAGNSNHWIRIRLRGRQSNAFGIGARIKVYNGSHIQTRDVLDEYIFNFGLAQNTTIDSVVVRWPSHVVDRLYNVPADRLLTVTEGVGDASVPTEFMFSQNYPNPFNGQTSIRYSIPGDGHTPGQRIDVSIAIFDVLGREVAVLQENPQPPGNYLITWDGKSRVGSNPPPASISAGSGRGSMYRRRRCYY